MRPVSAVELVSGALQSSLARARKNSSNYRNFGGQHHHSPFLAKRISKKEKRLKELKKKLCIQDDSRSQLEWTSTGKVTVIEDSTLETECVGVFVSKLITKWLPNYKCLNPGYLKFYKKKKQIEAQLQKATCLLDEKRVEPEPESDNTEVESEERESESNTVEVASEEEEDFGVVIVKENPYDLLQKLKEKRKERRKKIRAERRLKRLQEFEKLKKSVEPVQQLTTKRAEGRTGEEQIQLTKDRKKKVLNMKQNGELRECVNGISVSGTSNGHNSNNRECVNGISVSGTSNGHNSNNNGVNYSQNIFSNHLPRPRLVLYPREKILALLANDRTIPVGSGLINLGNTCYMNATLQALFHTPAFANWLLQDKEHREKCRHNPAALLNGNVCTICSMYVTMQDTIRNANGQTGVRPVLIHSKLKNICKHFSHGRQEDAHEFLRYLLESMERSYLSAINALKLDNRSKETNPLSQIFGGYLRTEVTCLKCHSISTTFHPLAELQLDIRHVTTLEDALQSHFRRERLENNDYKCEKCRNVGSATKQFSLEVPPFVLCLQLKRFTLFGNKISKPVHCSRLINITQYLHKSLIERGHPSVKYRLVAMVTHIGSSPNCGHYTAVAEAGNHYYQFDDSYVHQVSPQLAFNSDAYVIIYEMDRTSLASHMSSLQQSHCHSSVANGHVKSNVVSSSVSSCNANGSSSPGSPGKRHTIEQSFIEQLKKRKKHLSASSSSSFSSDSDTHENGSQDRDHLIKPKLKHKNGTLSKFFDSTDKEEKSIKKHKRDDSDREREDHRHHKSKSPNTTTTEVSEDERTRKSSPPKKPVDHDSKRPQVWQNVNGERRNSSQERERDRKRCRNPSRSSEEREKFSVAKIGQDKHFVTWSGSSSALSKTNGTDNHRNGNTMNGDDLDEEIDTGRVKKVRKSRSPSREDGKDVNPIQNYVEKQKQVSQWSKLLNGYSSNFRDLKFNFKSWQSHAQHRSQFPHRSSYGSGGGGRGFGKRGGMFRGGAFRSFSNKNYNRPNNHHRDHYNHKFKFNQRDRR